MIVWYCGKCRAVLKVKPKYAMERGCKCKVPMLPKSSTRVWS